MKKQMRRLAAAVTAVLLLSGCSGNISSDTPANSSSNALTNSSSVTSTNSDSDMPSSNSSESMTDSSSKETDFPEYSYKFEGTTPAESELYIKPVEGLMDSFIRGADVSSYLAEKESGVVYKDFDGKELDDKGFFDLLAQSGINCIRLRLWNDPKNEHGDTYGAGHCDLETVSKIGKLATDSGLSIMIDFHYSDFWADPQKYKAPKAWENLSFDDKKQALFDYTKESVKTLFDEGVNLTMVQIGNEINNGMSGETEVSKINELLAQGSSAVREASEEAGRDVKIAIHYTNTLEDETTDLINGLKTDNIDYDMLGLSFYTFWHGTPQELSERIKELKELTGKEIYIAETSYGYTFNDGDGSGNNFSADATLTLDYDVSVQGQANAVRDVIEAANNGGAFGVFYWEPAWIPVEVYDPEAPDSDEVLERNKAAWDAHGSGWGSSGAIGYDPDVTQANGSGWDNQALFDNNGNPLESLNVFKYVFSGTTAKLSVVKANDITFESGVGQELKLPETVPMQMNSGEVMEVSVVWNTDQVSAIDTSAGGSYEIDGTAAYEGTDYPVKCSLEILNINYIKNPGFEDEDMSMWKIDGNAVDRVEDNNKRSGTFSLKFWADEPVKFTVEQTITDIPTGTYNLGAFLQGGDAGDNAVFELYIKVNGEELTTPSKVTSWQNWDNPVINNIEIPDGAEVVVGVKVDAQANAWGAWDDFTLTEG